MQRVQTPTATAEKPPYSDSGTPGYFRPGDAVAAIPPTVPGAQWFNQVQGELVSAIVAAGLTPSGTDDTQLGQVITALLQSLALRASLASPAFSGNPTAPTPALFDATPKLATMEAVQRALGNIAGYAAIIASGSLTAAHCGKRLSLQGAGALTITLPLLTTVTAGAKLLLANNCLYNMTIQRQGTDLIYDPLGASKSSLVLYPGDTLDLESNGGGWMIFGGSLALRYASGAFGSSLAISGHQLLPSGLILQMTQVNASPTGTVVTWPIAFPNACFGVLHSNISGTTFARTHTTSGSLTGTTLTCDAAAPGIKLFALGN